MENKEIDDVFVAVSNYLKKKGWWHHDELDANWGYWTDPVTRLAHRSDFAFVVQSERDLNNLLNSKR